MRMEGKEGISMDTVTQNVYTYMKSLSDQNGFPPTIRQTAEQLKLDEQEVEKAIGELQRLGRVVITDIPAKSIIEMVEEPAEE